ncbi:hypothetical protein ENUP19_0146G0073 [Entamoeba nuttalli]|uniref:WD domain, G-beta repeat-containing protein n=2 Tax=Entamoeba nuttalli TaxID=412467 RepID=K2HH65_ENTNP|nr:WD domain, G-beta repeat-containing protein [Entamoeba nuttalli P19]EKE42264.1 WD domain, G-beta repeat-containing protein [Entamoeba nuttalli P19]|eukprot:XP_008855401.1 WD domain, G-beta repeat-containing protein [Entamoeba nuttalli P19]
MGKFHKLGWIQHEGKPINCIDVNPNKTKIITGGGDGYVKVWNASALSDISKQPKLFSSIFVDKSVNCCRYSFDGELIAAASATGKVGIFRLIRVSTEPIYDEKGNISFEEYEMVDGFDFGNEVMDISWSPKGEYLAVVTLKGNVIIWTLFDEAHSTTMLEESHQCAQGVSWDPLGQYIAIQCSDNFELWKVNPYQKIKEFPIKTLDVPNHWRRPSWSDDGSMVVGYNTSRNLPCLMVLKRHSLDQMILLTGKGRGRCAVRICSRGYHLSDEKKTKVYKLIMAVGDDKVCFWTTKGTGKGLDEIRGGTIGKYEDCVWVNKMAIIVGTEGTVDVIELNEQEGEGELLTPSQQNTILYKQTELIRETKNDRTQPPPDIESEYPLIKQTLQIKKRQNGDRILLQVEPGGVCDELICVNEKSSIVEWRTLLQDKIKFLKSSGKRTVIVLRNNNIIMIDNRCGSLKVPLKVQNEEFYNLFFSKKYVCLLKGKDRVIILDKHLEFVQEINISNVLEKTDKRKIIGLQYYDESNSLLIQFEEKVEFIIRESHDVIMIQQGLKNLTEEQMISELECSLLTLPMIWNENRFKETIETYVSIIQKNLDYNRLRNCLRVIEKIKLKEKTNLSLLEEWSEKIQKSLLSYSQNN